MATTKEYKEYVMEKLNILNDITIRPMMGEYLLYYNKILFGGIYDNKVLIKKVEENKVFNLEEVIPYKGAKPMYYLSDLENAEALKQIIFITSENLPKKIKK